MKIKPNNLAKEKSPYLLQHQYNPVNWFAWSEEAFTAAKDANKPIFLSIGYSTCYWCHVMEKDSFEDSSVAEILNQNFISIKVDREERPDIDAIYMDAVVAINGHGGWPLSVFLNTDLEPFWGGTFFYKENFKQILFGIAKAWQEQAKQIKDSASELKKYLVTKLPEKTKKIDKEIFDAAIIYYKKNFDKNYGGFSKAPKFPVAMQVGFLLRQFHFNRDSEILEMVELSLKKMADGGIFDQLAGGFARYSTDEHWLIPHFEKMLYDNALLAISYIETYQVTNNNFYGQVAEDILEYVLNNLCDQKGAFFSAQDAGEVGKEGEYYVWSKDELQKILSKSEFALLSKIYNLKENFEHEKIVLSIADSGAWELKRTKEYQDIRLKLLQVRNNRKSPHIDDKILTAWNALMISAFVKAYQAFDKEKYLSAAKKALNFIVDTLYKNNLLYRRFRADEIKQEAFLEDYAFLIQSLLDIYDVTGSAQYLKVAQELQSIQDQLFWDDESGGYYYSNAKELVVRKKDFIDNAIPSGNSAALKNLIRLGSQYLAKADKLAGIYCELIARYPAAFPYALQALDFYINGVGCVDDFCKVPAGVQA